MRLLVLLGAPLMVALLCVRRQGISHLTGRLLILASIAWVVLHLFLF